MRARHTPPPLGASQIESVDWNANHSTLKAINAFPVRSMTPSFFFKPLRPTKEVLAAVPLLGLDKSRAAGAWERKGTRAGVRRGELGMQ